MSTVCRYIDFITLVWYILFVNFVNTDHSRLQVIDSIDLVSLPSLPIVVPTIYLFGFKICYFTLHIHFLLKWCFDMLIFPVGKDAMGL